MAGQTYQQGRLRVRDGARESWEPIYPADLDTRPPGGDLICFGCSAWMSWVEGFMTKNDTPVLSHLRLWRGYRHEVDCKLQLETLGRDLKREFPDTVELEDKLIYVRLPEDAMQKVMQPTTTGGAARRGSSWASTLSTAVKVVKFLRHFEDAGDYLNRLKIRYRDARGDIKEMFWSEFCFDARSRWSYSYYKRLHDAPKADAVPPVAVLFTLRQAPKLSHNGEFRMVRLDTLHLLDGDRRLYISAAVPATSPLLTNLNPGDTILALGRGVEFDWDPARYQVTELRIDIDRADQLAVVPS